MPLAAGDGSHVHRAEHLSVSRLRPRARHSRIDLALVSAVLAGLETNPAIRLVNLQRETFCRAENRSPQRFIPYRGTLNVPLISGNGSSGTGDKRSGLFVAAIFSRRC